MLHPIARPLEPAHSKVAGLLAYLTGTPGETLTLTTLAVRSVGGVTANVIFHLGDGGREHLSASEARDMAGVLRDGADIDSRWAAWADSLDEAAETAERQASAVFLAIRESYGVAAPREFRGMR